LPEISNGDTHPRALTVIISAAAERNGLREIAPKPASFAAFASHDAERKVAGGDGRGT